MKTRRTAVLFLTITLATLPVAYGKETSAAAAQKLADQVKAAKISLAAGVIGAFVFAHAATTKQTSTAPPRATANTMLLAPAAAGAFSGTTAKLFLFFFKSGLLVFGSGLVIVPRLPSQWY